VGYTFPSAFDSGFSVGLGTPTMRPTIYFKPYKSQIPVVEQALETAALMLGSDKSRGYCLEMICADFLAGANLNDGDPDVLLHALSRSFHFLLANQRQVFLQTISDEVQ